MVMGVARLESGIGADAIEAAKELSRHLTDDGQAGRIAFHGKRREIAFQKGVPALCLGHGFLPPGWFAHPQVCLQR
jgi:hypothetical protein